MHNCDVVPEKWERRTCENGNPPINARAFAAELLLPREIACQRVERHGAVNITGKILEEIIQELAETFQVSTGLVVHQLRNSRLLVSLPREVQSYLRRRNNEVVGRGDEFESG